MRYEHTFVRRLQQEARVRILKYSPGRKVVVMNWVGVRSLPSASVSAACEAIICARAERCVASRAASISSKM